MDSLERIKYNIPDILPDHEAYGYSWNVWTGEDIDKPEPDMRYVGYKGEPWDGTYTHSSELELFINDLRSSKRVEYTLEYWGYKTDAANWEDDFLRKHKAKSLKTMYNQTSHGQHAKTDKHVNNLYEDYTNGALDKYNEQVRVDHLLDLYKNNFRVQGRAFDDVDHQKDITAQIDKNHGNTDVCKVVTFKDYYGPGVDKIADGGHTIPGVADAKIFASDPDLTITVCRIPKSRWKKLHASDDVTLGQMLNPRPKFRKKETGPQDVIKGMKKRFVEKGIPFDGHQNQLLYSGPGYEYDFKQVAKFAEKAAKEHRKEDTSSKGRKLANPQAYHIQEKKKNKIEKLKKDNPYSIIVGITTGNFKWADVWYEIIVQKEEKPEAVELILVTTYSLPGINDTAVQDWENKKKQEIHKTLWKEVETVYGLKIKEDPMSRWEDDGSA